MRNIPSLVLRTWSLMIDRQFLHYLSIFLQTILGAMYNLGIKLGDEKVQPSVDWIMENCVKEDFDYPKVQNSCLKSRSHLTRAKKKVKNFFNVCHLSFDLSYCFLNLFSFSSHFRCEKIGRMENK